MVELFETAEAQQFTSCNDCAEPLQRQVEADRPRVAAQPAAPALPEAGGMRNVDAPRRSNVIEALTGTVFRRTVAEEHAYEAADRILPTRGQDRFMTQSQLDALGRHVVRPGMENNSREFVDYLQRSLRAAGYTNASVITGTEVHQNPPSHPDSAYHPATRIPYIEIRDQGLRLRIRY